MVESHGNTRDTEIVDNGDGTLTISFKDATATKVWLDGTFLFHDTGLAEGALLVDHNGTPTIPDDDVFLGPVGEIGLTAGSTPRIATSARTSPSSSVPDRSPAARAARTPRAACSATTSWSSSAEPGAGCTDPGARHPLP